MHIGYNERTAIPASTANLPNRTAREIYRITQEVTMNIIKHANASRIDILFFMDTDENIQLQITDNGTPIATEHNKQEVKGIGLRTISGSEPKPSAPPSKPEMMKKETTLY